MEQRSERVVFETDRYRITGAINLPREGYRSRVTDFLNSAERDFIAVQDAVVEPLDGSGAPREHDFLVLSRRKIVLVAPDGDADR